jgi:hypothetical protein
MRLRRAHACLHGRVNSTRFPGASGIPRFLVIVGTRAAGESGLCWPRLNKVSASSWPIQTKENGPLTRYRKGGTFSLKVFATVRRMEGSMPPDSAPPQGPALVDAILHDPVIAVFIKTNQFAAERIRHAATLLIEQGGTDVNATRIVAALQKLLPSLAEQVVNIFFSFKKKDERTARAIVDLLRENSAGKLRITYQGDFTQVLAGQEWRAKIREAVRDANWFILLLPDPSDELDWCLFETGVFYGQLTCADRLICLHHPDTAIPSPIEGYHAVAATVPEAEKFLRMVFIEADAIHGLPPINPAIEQLIPDLANRFVKAIREPKRRLNRVTFEPWIEIAVENAANLKTMDDLDSATIEAENDKALALFDLIEHKKTFGELRQGIPENGDDGRWREELFHVIRKIANGRRFDTVQAVLHARNGKICRPVVLAVDRAGPGGPILSFHITFAEDVSTANIAAMPKKLAVLATLVRFAFRFRWEVLEPFGRAPLGDEEVKRLENSMARIKADWESRGSMDGDAVVECFTPEQRRRLNEMFAAYHRLRTPYQDGELDIAMKNRDGARIPALLASLLPSNQEFLEMAAERFAGMVAEVHRPSAG